MFLHYPRTCQGARSFDVFLYGLVLLVIGLMCGCLMACSFAVVIVMFVVDVVVMVVMIVLAGGIVDAVSLFVLWLSVVSSFFFDFLFLCC